MKNATIDNTEDHITVEGLESSATKLVAPGAVLLVMRSGILRHSIPVAINRVPVALNQDMRALTPLPRLEARYLARLMEGHQQQLLNAWSKVGSTVESLESDLVGETEIAVPPLPQQRAIADYLDRETARLDALVAAKERVLGLLAEKRRALITRAVTHGLDPRAPLRDSGIPWLGEIPLHWGATRLKFVAEVRGGLTLGKRYGTADLVELPYLRVANVQDGHLDLSDVATVLAPPAEAATCMLEAGDVLMNEGGDADKLGRGCVWRGEIAPCLHQNHVFAVRPRRVLSDWLNTWTSTDGAKAFFECRAKQSTNLASISATNINELPIPLPPPGEQRAIVDQVNSELAKLAELRAATERTTALLKERRAALIAAAVAGRIDVGGALA
jgi:type I restriction enzyme S subunit